MKMKLHKFYLICIIILLAELGLGVYLGHKLPPDVQIPMHWNIHNQIDGWTNLNAGIYGFWFFNLGLFLIMMFLSKYSPVYQREKEEKNQSFPLLIMGLVFFFALIHMYMLIIAGDPNLDKSGRGIYLFLGLLFIFIGNIAPKLSRNYFAGFKTPWTFYSDEIWRKTSRMGGYLFFVLGMMFLLGGIFHLTNKVMGTVLIIWLFITVFVPMLYSFLLYQKAKKSLTSPGD